MEINKANTPSKTCRNCQAAMPEAAKYCSACSQKYTTGRISIKDFISEFFVDYLNIDAKLPKTLIALFIPGKLTAEYFTGKHKSFASPLRLFVFTGILLFAYLGIQMKAVDIEDDTIIKQLHEHVNWLDVQEQLEIAKIKTDSIFPESVAATDSLMAFVIDSVGIISDSIDLNDNFGIENFKVPILSKRDLLNDNQDELIKKYGKKWGFFEKIGFKQALKLSQGIHDILDYFIGNLSLTIFFMMPFLALLLKLLYIRRDYFYVEHLTFAFHYHAFLFLIIFFLSLTGGWLPPLIMGLLIVGNFLYLYFAMLRVYQQAWFKTMIKFFTVLFGYLFIMVLISVLSFMISFFMF